MEAAGASFSKEPMTAVAYSHVGIYGEDMIMPVIDQFTSVRCVLANALRLMAKIERKLLKGTASPQQDSKLLKKRL